VGQAGRAGAPSPWAVRSWPVWGLPTRVLWPVLLVEMCAVGLVASQVVGLTLTRDHLVSAAMLAVLGALHTEVSFGLERVRRRIVDGNYVDLASVWTFSAAILLPAPLAAAVAVVVVGHLWFRAWRRQTPLFKFSFNLAAVVLACLAASAVMAAVAGGPVPAADGDARLVAIVLAVLAYTTVNSCLVAGAIALATARPDPTTVFASWNENLLELATLCLGAIVALTFVVNPLLLVLVLPPLLVLQRSVLVSQLEEKASTDGKTGLLNAAAWHTQAERELRRAERRAAPRAVLVVDLDHFKHVNDRHGHLAGDEVLAAVADALRAEVRDRDLVGRFGGEEFVVLLGTLGDPQDGAAELTAVAERIRGRIAALRVEMPTADGPLTVAGLSASVGAALYPDHGRDVRTLLQVADTALYAAKRAGRNVVRMGMHLPAPATGSPRAG
jgi:diguanylate cyclase (GGDEF)-like protein